MALRIMTWAFRILRRLVRRFIQSPLFFVFVIIVVLSLFISIMDRAQERQREASPLLPVRFERR